MNILHVIDSLRVGGSESLAATLAEQFAKHGVGSHICGLGVDGHLRQRLDQAGIKTTYLGHPSGIKPAAMLALGRLSLQHSCSVILTHHFRQLVHAVPASFLLRKRLIHVEHDYHSYEKRPNIVRRFGQLAPFVHTFAFVSEEIRDWFATRIPSAAGKYVAITNGIDMDRFKRNEDVRKKIRREIGAAPETVVVGTCARLEPIKDHALLLDGFTGMLEALREEGRDARLVLIGDGTLRQELEERAARNGIVEKCVFTGVRDNVPDWLSALDAYAITSIDEGLPLSVMEAMSTGLPVVAVDVGSLASIVDEEVGVLLEDRSPETLSRALLRMTTTDAAGLGEGARTRIKERHSAAVMAQAYLDRTTL